MKKKRNIKTYILFSIELVTLVLMLLTIFTNSNVKRISIADWESNYVDFDDGWYVDENLVKTDEIVDIIYGPYKRLNKGTYTVWLEYESDYDQSCLVYANSGNDKYIKTSLQRLKKDQKNIKYDFTLTRSVNNFELVVKYNGQGRLKIHDIEIIPDTTVQRTVLAVLLFLFFIVDIFVYLKIKWKRTYIFLLTEAIVLILLQIVIIHRDNLAINTDIINWYSNYVKYEDGWHIDENIVKTEEQIDMIYGPYIELEKGDYSVKVDYICDQDQTCMAYAGDGKDAYIKTQLQRLDHNKKSATYEFALTRTLDNFEFLIKYNGQGSLKISDIEIQPNTAGLKRNAIVLLCCFIILDNFLYLRRWWKFAYLLLRGNGETSDIYISCKNDIEKLKGINIREIITRYLKKWTIAIVRLLIKLKILLVTLLSNMDRGLMLYAFLFSCMLVVGGKMNLRGNPYFHPMIFADFLWIAVLFCLSLVVSSILKLINSKCLIEMQTGEISKRWWPCAWLLLIILWSPYLLAYYPGTLSADSFTSLEQVKDLGLLYNHVPIAYTLLIAFFVRIGWEIGDANFGVFLFSFIQMVVMAGVLSYSSYWVRKKVKYPVAAFGTLLFYGLNPIVALYSITMWKDVLFSAWIILLCLFLFDIAEDGGRKLGEKKSLLWIGLLFILISFGRNNGVYVVFFCWIVLLLIYKNVRKKLLLLGGGIILSVALIQGPGYKSLGIAQTGFVESVGIPLQQICYTVVTDGPLEEKEQEFLENIIPIDAIKKNYSPVSADDIKFNKEFNTSFFEQNKPGFVKLYLKLLPSHFQAYVQAYLLSTSGFWHIEPIYWVTAEEIYENDMGIYNVDYLKKYFHFDWKKVVSRMVSSLRDGPLANVGLMVWFVFFYAVMCFSQKQSWKSILALPLIGCWLTLMIATPVNSQFRYVYYYHLMLPIVFILFFVGKENL